MFKNKTILVTGGTGSWGQELTKQLLRFGPKELRVFSRNEYSQVSMQRRFNDSGLKFIIGDIRDYQAVNDACRDVDIVFHLAALKHVPICEHQPEEALKTNVAGTENIIRASIEQKVKRVVDVSTDKAVDPVNLYGMTKAIGEKLMIRANDLSEDTRFVCIRGGNVLGTNGSVVPYFKQLISQGRDLTLTSNQMTRFFLTIPEAIDLLLKAAQDAIGGETFVMKMKACKILDLAEVLIKRISSRPIDIIETGIRPGEKLHEVLVSNFEARNTVKYGEQYYVILPSHPNSTLTNHYANYERVDFDQYDSNVDLMSHDEIAALLKQGGFL